MSAIATVSSKFQISIPKEVREQLGVAARPEGRVHREARRLPDRPGAETRRLGGDSSRRQHGGLSRPERSILMRVVDTSAWIEWVVGSPLGETVGAGAAEERSGLSRLLFNMSCRVGSRGRCRKPRPARAIAFSTELVVAPLTHGHSDEGGGLSRKSTASPRPMRSSTPRQPTRARTSLPATRISPNCRTSSTCAKGAQ